MDDAFHKEFEETWNGYGSSGQRVIAFATLALPGADFPADFNFSSEPNSNFPMDGLVSSSSNRHSIPTRTNGCFFVNDWNACD